MIKKLAGPVLTVLVGAAFVATLGFVLHQRPSPAIAAAPKPAASAHAYLHLSTYPDSLAGEHGKDGGAEPDWVSYGPTTTLTLPANSLVTVTISQYDGGEAITNPWFAKVQGTIGGTETVDGKPVTHVDPETIGHTFTIHAAPTAQDPLFVNAPLPAVPDDAPVADGSMYPKPIAVTFSFRTKGPGTYVWNCEFPCGDGTYAKFGGPMSTRGYMSGTLTVV
ncbi:MAG: hypothetical protein ACR2MB_16685 [Acidimicrobiales bacterium]